MLTAESITADQIREYARDHWRDPWMGGGNGKGTVGDGCIVALASSHPDLSLRCRAEFARLINARAKDGAK